MKSLPIVESIAQNDLKLLSDFLLHKCSWSNASSGNALHFAEIVIHTKFHVSLSCKHEDKKSNKNCSICSSILTTSPTSMADLNIDGSCAVTAWSGSTMSFMLPSQAPTSLDLNRCLFWLSSLNITPTLPTWYASCTWSVKRNYFHVQLYQCMSFVENKYRALPLPIQYSPYYEQ